MFDSYKNLKSESFWFWKSNTTAEKVSQQKNKQGTQLNNTSDNVIAHFWAAKISFKIF